MIKAKFSTVYEKNKDLIHYYENQRNEDSFDTCFKYELKDNKKFNIIEKAVQNVK